MSEKIPSNASVANSPSPAINTVVKNSWIGGVPQGQTAEQALADKYTKHPIDPGSLKK